MRTYRTIEEAAEEVFKDCKKAAIKAAQEASKKAMDDLYAMTVSCLRTYYNEYQPTGYSRTYHLIDSFVPYVNDVKVDGDTLICSGGVEFDPSRIAGIYHASQNLTGIERIPLEEWIIDNFLAGIHPRTNGSPMPGGGEYESSKFQSDFVPGVEIQKYIDNYDETFDRNFYRAVGKQILRMMRK
jgi:hypothetical protein